MKRNWKKYNRSLINRGSITFWFSEDILKNWTPEKKKQRGRPQLFSNQAIIAACILRFTFSISLRMAEGFLRSVLLLLKADIPTPSYTRVCRRMKSLDLSHLKSKRRPTDIVFDSTGLKIYGEGEWKISKHGEDKRKIWKKLHIALCPNSGEIIVNKLTSEKEADCTVLPELLIQCPKSIKRAYGDGGYDTTGCRETLQSNGIEGIIPPRRNAKAHFTDKTKARDEALFIIEGLGGNEAARSIWKKASNYHRRSLVETAFSRWKRLLGGALRHRLMGSQASEVSIKSYILNQMLRTTI